jgi:hypothetical protein
VAALRNAHTRSEQPLAAIPLLFGVQQLSEGVIWLTFTHDAPLLQQTMTYVYSGFSHVLWPMYVPFAIAVLETARWRKKTLFAFEAAGIAVGLYLLYSIVTRPLVAEIAGRHIVYDSPHFYLLPVMVVTSDSEVWEGFRPSPAGQRQRRRRGAAERDAMIDVRCL